MSRVLDAVAPRRLGPGFRWLLASSWTSNLGDGLALAAGPLLVASLTSDAFVVALASTLQMLPWVGFGLYAGVLADRVDRRRLVVAANLVRGSVLAVLAATVFADVVTVPVVLVAMFCLGTAETFVDTTTSTLLPMLVDGDDLGVANARLQFGNNTINRLAAPPIGAALFAVGASVPFAAHAISILFAVVLVARIGATPPARTEISTSVRSEIAEGVKWVWSNPAIRLLVLTILSFNITFGAVHGIFVLYVAERLGLGELGFGVFVAFGAAGAILGTLVYTRLERLLGRSGIMRAGLVIETGTHLVLALTSRPAIAFGTMFVFGVHEAAWGTTASSLRQRLVPNELQGRVTSVYMLSVLGSMVVGQVLGGVMAGIWGITAPFWFGFVGSAAILTVMWPRFVRLG
ncbi:MAG: MFS transporter [Ilumatobacteraceae bacterium]